MLDAAFRGDGIEFFPDLGGPADHLDIVLVPDFILYDGRQEEQAHTGMPE